MKRFKIILLLFPILVLVVTGCKKYKIETDPSKAILGKWVIIEMGNWPIMERITEPSGYKEYLTDSVLREYEYKTGNTFIKKYWIDSLLHVSISNGDSPQLLFEYKYVFYDNKLRLDVTNFYMIYNTSVYKKL